MSPRRAAARLAVVLGILIALTPARAWPQPARSSGEPEIPAATGYVNDRAQVMDEPTRAKLEAFLDQVQRKTGAQFAVLTVPNTQPLTPAEYKVKVFERWGIGSRGKDEGLLLLVAVEEREVWFETGYGLEGVLPDGLEARIVRERVVPRFRDGDFAAGIVAGVLEASARIAAEKGVTLEWDGRELRYDRRSRGRRISWIWALLIFWLVALLISRIGGSGPRGRRRLFRGGMWGPTIGGWGGGFGGGFGGGSFGGFGGGASGGGGGGGRW